MENETFEQDLIWIEKYTEGRFKFLRITEKGKVAKIMFEGKEMEIKTHPYLKLFIPELGYAGGFGMIANALDEDAEAQEYARELYSPKYGEDKNV